MGLRTESRFGRSEMWSGQAVGPNRKSKPEIPKEDIRRDKRKKSDSAENEIKGEEKP